MPKLKISPLASVVFCSRWLQLPLYLGLIFIQGVYTIRFITEVYELVTTGIHLSEADMMLAVLGLIDVVLISNLLIMVIIAGYETYVSRLNLESHPDHPKWLIHVGTGTLKIKLALSLVGIASVDLLETFMRESPQPGDVVMWRVIIFAALNLSALLIAWIDRMDSSEH
jgi:uncharacterized protein (TIGR00645 family)